MLKRKQLLVLAVFILLAGAFSSCLPSSSTQPTGEVSQATRSAAATLQAQMNLLQIEAFELERELDENFSEHYVGINTESYPNPPISYPHPLITTTKQIAGNYVN